MTPFTVSLILHAIAERAKGNNANGDNDLNRNNLNAIPENMLLIVKYISYILILFAIGFYLKTGIIKGNLASVYNVPLM